MRRLLPIHSNSKLMPVDLTSYVTTFLVKRNNVKQCFETWSFNLQPWHICISFVHFQWMYLWQNWFATYPFTPGSTYYLPLFLEHPHSHLLTLLCCGQPVLNNTLWDRLTDLDMLLKYSGHSQINVNNSIGVTLNSSLPKKKYQYQKGIVFSLQSYTYLSFAEKRLSQSFGELCCMLHWLHWNNAILMP